ncbi:N-acetyltransferase family protein [Hyphomonas sp.]|uniref:GNAT family N-acetyltransferase n=1 Tax=Hyphomonas sp. TaxID=87 RepID=UPI0039189EE8
MGHALKTTPLPKADENIVRIRDADSADMAAVQAIYAHFVRNTVSTFEEITPSTGEMLVRRDAVLAHGLPWLVAEADGQVVGYACASPYRPGPAYQFTAETSVYVSEGFGGQGIGSELLGELVRRCEAGRWRQMVAIIGSSRNEACIRLHRNHGFASVGTFKAVGYKFGQWVDTVLMQRAIGEGEWSSPGL